MRASMRSGLPRRWPPARPARATARRGRAGADHRPGRPHAALPGHRAARRRLAGGGRRASISASPSRSRPRSACRVAKQLIAGGDGAARALAGRRHAGAVPAGSAGAHAPARSAGRRWRRADARCRSIRPTIPGRNAGAAGRPSSRPSWPTRASAPSGCSTGCSTSTACASSKAQGRRRMLLLAREDPRHPRRLLGRGDRGQHRGRRDQGQLRVLLEGLSVRPGGVRTECASRRVADARCAPQFTVRDLPGISSEKAGMSTSKISPRALRIV